MNIIVWGQRVIKRRILAGDFTATDPDHIALVKQMGVNLMSLPDGRVQLLHTFANAESQVNLKLVYLLYLYFRCLYISLSISCLYSIVYYI